MPAVSEHLLKNLLAGLAALLPATATIAAVVYAEQAIAKSGLSQQPFYFPGLGLLAVVVGLYVTGLLVSTLVGRWLVRLFDRLFTRLPLLKTLYRTAKSCLALGEDEDSYFRKAVLVQRENTNAAELGLLTNTISSANGESQAVVFLPSSPNPLYGRLILVPETAIAPAGMTVRDALQVFITTGARLSTSVQTSSVSQKG